MSFKCQIYQKRLTLNNVSVKNCDVRLIIIFCLIAATTTILPIIKCAKLENPQIRLLINDDDLLQEKSNIHEAAAAAATAIHDNSGEHFNLYRSELKRLSYETIHRILRDENEPSYRREDTELRYYQKRSPSYEESHQLMKRDTTVKKQDSTLSFSKRNLREFLITAAIEKELSTASVLDLSDNYLSFLNISQIDKFSYLNSLNLKNNSLTFIPLSEQSLLKSLNLNHNLVHSSQLPSNIYLRNLYLSSNYIENLSAIQLSLLKNLESLDVSFNRLRNTESSYFPERMHNLKHLNLAYNQLGSIYRETFYNLLSLNTLLLSHNNISDIDYETFLALPNLQYLDLSYNRLRGKSIRALQGITGLVALNIAYNPEIGPFMQEFVASWSLKELDASGTGLCQIPAALAQSVRSLKLTHNWLKIINCGDLDSYPLLQYLDLSNSHIEYIEDDAMGRLEILEILMLDHNQLKKIPFSLPVSLEHLFLQNNDIMEIPQQAFQGLNNLKTLDLSHNKLMYLPDLSLAKLVTLNLQSSEIKGINQGIVHTLPKLNDLMLEDNPIKCSDLLGIAEWASTCRLRIGKDEEEQIEEVEDEEFVERINDLKNKFIKMHNFYEKFPMSNCKDNQSLLTDFITKPSCVNSQQYQMITSLNKDKNAEVDVKETSLNLLTYSSAAHKESSMLMAQNLQETTAKTNKVKNFNQNSMISIPTTTAIETFDEYNNKTDANGKNALKQQKQQEEKQKEEEEEDAATTIRMQNYDKTTKATAETKHSDIIKGKQTFKTTTKTFNNPTATILSPTIQATDVKPQHQQQQQHQQQHNATQNKFVVQPRYTNVIKTFFDKDLTATTAGTATTTRSATKDEIASIGNSQTQSLPTMTEVVEKATKRAKDANVKITSKSLEKLKTKGKEKQENNEKLVKTKTLINSQEQESQTRATTIFTAQKMFLADELQQQQQDDKTKISTRKVIKSLTTRTIKSSTNMQIPNEPTTSTTIGSIEITTTLKERDTANLNNAQKDLNGEFSTISPVNTSNMQNSKAFYVKPTSYITNTSSTAGAINKDMIQTLKTKAAAILKTTTIEVEAAAAVKDKDLASNYNDNDNNRLTTTNTTTMPFINSNKTNSNKTITTTSSSFKNIANNDNQMLVPLDIPITTFTNVKQQNDNIIEVDHRQQQQQQQQQPKENVMFYQSLPKDVNVKCMQSNSNECNSSKPQRQEEIGKTPTVEATIEMTTSKPLAATTVATTTTTTLAVIHKHEPLQLLVKDRHLIGTPLLMHKGENLMVTADELILPTTNHHDDNAEADKQDNNNDNNKQHDIETTTTVYSKINKPSLDQSQQHTADKRKYNISQDKKHHDQQQQQQEESNNKLKKSNLELLKTKKPSLIMKKMTIITKQHKDIQEQQHGVSHIQEPKENEVHQRNFDNTHYQELKPILKKVNPEMPHNLRHSTVNTPINKEANLLKEPHTFQHEHELLVQQILEDQMAERHDKFSKTEQWSDLRKSETKETHQSGLILLVSSGLFLVLLLGLMHVYRCDMPWRRHHTAAHHLRPHQRPNNTLGEDDSRSFLSYNEGMQKWHHSTRLEAPYNSPLHNLHVRELQKTSATEKAATVKTSAVNFRQPPSRSVLLPNSRSLSQSSTASTSTTSPSSSAILDDESFYIEMTPDSGQLAHALQSELLPMELLNMAQLSNDSKKTTAEDTSMEDNDDNCLPSYQQTQLRHTQSSHPAVPTSSTSFNVKPQTNSRKFGLW